MVLSPMKSFVFPHIWRVNLVEDSESTLKATYLVLKDPEVAGNILLPTLALQR